MRFPRTTETQLIVEYLRDTEDGTFVSYDDLSELIGMDTAHWLSPGRRRITSALRILAREGVNIESRKGGLYRLIPEEFYQTTTKALRRTRNAANMAIVKTHRGLSLDVPEESRLRLAAERVVLAMHVQMSKPSRTSEIQEQLQAQPSQTTWEVDFDFSKILR